MHAVETEAARPPRHLLQGPHLIVSRMADDVRDMLAEAGELAVISKDDLHRQGWTWAQIAQHGEAAIRAAKEPVMAIIDPAENRRRVIDGLEQFAAEHQEMADKARQQIELLRAADLAGMVS